MDLVKLEKLFIEEVSGVSSPANQLDGFMICKSRGSGEFVIKNASKNEAKRNAVERLRKAAPSDEIFVALLTGDAMIFNGHNYKGVLKRTGHDGLTRHPTSGKFVPMQTKTDTAIPDVQWTHSGAVVRALGGTA